MGTNGDCLKAGIEIKDEKIYRHPFVWSIN